jgi:zinc protease
MLRFLRCSKGITPLFLFGALLLGHSLGYAQSDSAVTVQKLSNGMRVIVSEDHRAPTVAQMVWYKAGSVDEVNGKTGVAHVLEHMMFKGTKAVPGGEFSRRVAAIGGRENAFTSRDYTGYFQQIPKDKLAQMMEIEADRMSNLQLTKEDFEKEIKVVMEERRMRTEDQATSIVYEQLIATAFIAHPYRAPVVGWMNDLEAMTYLDAQEWYNTWYTPSNAVLVIAGDVNAKEVIQLAERYYGSIPVRALPARKPQVEPEQRGERRAFVKAAAENPYVVMGFKVPKLVNPETDKEPYALEVLSAILGLDESGRLTKNVVRGSRVANSSGVNYELASRGPALFLLDGVPAEGKSTKEVEDAVLAEVRKIATEGVSEAELKRIKTQYVAATVFKRDSIFGQARELVALEIIDLSWRDADRILEKIKLVTGEEIKAVAGKYFGDDQRTVMTLLPQPIDKTKSAKK